MAANILDRDHDGHFHVEKKFHHSSIHSVAVHFKDVQNMFYARYWAELPEQRVQ